MPENETRDWLLSHGFQTTRISGYQIIAAENCCTAIETHFSELRGQIKQLQNSGGRGTRNCQLKIPDLGTVFLKQYHHGGLLAEAEDTIYRSPQRFLRELKATHKLYAGPGSVPRPLAALVKETAQGYRGYYLSRALDARPLSERLRGQANTGWLQAAGQLLAKIHAAGVDPLDFHVDNLLVDGADDLFVVDFDPVNFQSPSAWRRAFRLHRFGRSLTKYGFSGRSCSRFKSGYEEEFSSWKLTASSFFQKPFWKLKNKLSDLLYYFRENQIKPIEREKIVVRAPNWIGDAVMSLPLLQSLGEATPRNTVDVIARASVAEVYKHSPVVDIIHVLEEKAFDYPRSVKTADYSGLVVLTKSWRTGIQAGLSGIPRRFGLATRGRGLFFTDRTPLNGLDKQKHHARIFYRAAGDLAKQPSNKLPAPQLTVEPERPEQFKKLDGPTEFMTIHPGAAYGPAKRWPAEAFRELVRRATEKFELGVVALGVESEREQADKILGELTAVSSLNLVGETELARCMRILAASRLMIANDSGLMHLAAGLGTPTVGIFGSTDPNLTEPLGEKVRVVYEAVECSPCFQRNCPRDEERYKCLKKIMPETVLKSALKLLDGDKYD